MTNTRQLEWDAYSPPGLSSHAPSHAYWPTSNQGLLGRGCTGPPPPPPTWAEVSVKTRGRLAWQKKKGKNIMVLNTCTTTICGERLRHGGDCDKQCSSDMSLKLYRWFINLFLKKTLFAAPPVEWHYFGDLSPKKWCLCLSLNIFVEKKIVLQTT